MKAQRINLASIKHVTPTVPSVWLAQLVAGLALAFLLATSSHAGDGAPDHSQDVVVGDPGGKDHGDRVGKLHLHCGEIATAELRDRLDDVTPRFTDNRHLLLQLDGPITASRRAALEGLGVQLDEYVPHFAYVARLGGVARADLRALGFVIWVGDYSDDWKIDRSFGTRELADADRRQLAAAGLVTARVTFFAGIDREQALGDLATLTGLRHATVHECTAIAGGTVITMTLRASDVADLADLAAVQFVEEAPEFTLRNSTVRWQVQAPYIASTPFYDNGLHGESQVIGLIDSKVDPLHCSFLDIVEPIGPNHRKILAYNGPRGADYHGTAVATTALGDDGYNSDRRGVAYESKLVFSPVPTYTEADVYSSFVTAHYQGARIHSNSWGDDSTTAYNALCRGIDAFAWDFEESLVVWGVTNTPTLKNPENAKNLLAVGASELYSGSHCTGGSGPTDDGRLKPEVLAPGCGVNTAVAVTDCDTDFMSGTSIAAAATSGAAALVRQYYTRGHYPSGYPIADDSFLPSAALIKATLINSATDTMDGEAIPNPGQGWGRVVASDSCYFPGDGESLVVLDDERRADGLVTNDYREYAVQVTAATDMRITLAWTDAPASAATGSGPAAVNDLDLSVMAPDGTWYLGNVFANGVSVAGGWWDYDNNVEQVHLAATPGIYVIRVAAPAVNWDAQGFAIIATGKLYQIANAIQFCGRGAVNAGCGSREDILTVNASNGGIDRTLHVKQSTPLSFEMSEPVSQIGDGFNSAACIYMWFSDPLDTDLMLMPKQLGLMCFGPYFNTTQVPSIIFNSLGYNRKLGTHNAQAPLPYLPDTGQMMSFYDLPNGLGTQATITAQGIVPDWCSQGNVPYSVTNAVLVNIH